MSWVIVVITFVLTFLLCLGLHEWDVSYLKSTQQTALDNQAATLQLQCKSVQQTTTEVDNALHKQDILIAGNYDSAVQLLINKSSMPAATRTTLGNHGAAFDNRLYYSDVRAALALAKRQEVASHQANQLLQCQQLLLKERQP